MTLEQIHDIAVSEFGLAPRLRADGWSYWAPETATSNAVRILRVSRDAHGGVAEIKLARTSLAAQQDVSLSAPFTAQCVREAIAAELRAER